MDRPERARSRALGPVERQAARREPERGRGGCAVPASCCASRRRGRAGARWRGRQARRSSTGCSTCGRRAVPAAAGSPREPRPYQRIGVEWLRFLWENRLAGLLCDDMGLGKTLQTARAPGGLLREEKAVTEPFLVACPTSVLPHWRDQIAAARAGPAAASSTMARSGGCRPGCAPGDVLITSYGVLRRDAEALSAVPFSVAVFDEVQQIKNRQTQALAGRGHLVADVKLGLTGTPIENSLEELKTLFDLILPGYLGSDAAFGTAIGGGDRSGRRGAAAPSCGALVSPFVLRRLKTHGAGRAAGEDRGRAHLRRSRTTRSSSTARPSPAAGPSWSRRSKTRRTSRSPTSTSSPCSTS